MMNNSDKIIISLFDYSGVWSSFYKKNGYTVIRHDLKRGQDIFDDTLPAAIQDSIEGLNIYGLLAAVPCTDFAGSGARWWEIKESMPAGYNGKNVSFDNTVEMAVAMVLVTLFIVELLKPGLWSLENPVGRLHKLVPEIGSPKMYFQPYEFGEPYTKKTALYGEFNTNLKKKLVEPTEGSMMWKKYGGKSERTKELRSKTPVGFAKAFYEANQ